MRQIENVMVRHRITWTAIAKRLRVSRSTLNRWRAAGFTPAQLSAVEDVVSELVQEVSADA